MSVCVCVCGCVCVCEVDSCSPHKAGKSHAKNCLQQTGSNVRRNLSALANLTFMQKLGNYAKTTANYYCNNLPKIWQCLFRSIVPLMISLF